MSKAKKIIVSQSEADRMIGEAHKNFFRPSPEVETAMRRVLFDDSRRTHYFVEPEGGK